MKIFDLHSPSEWERRLANFSNKFSLQEEKVSRFVTANRKQFHKMTIKQIAGAAGVSEATVVRFCHRLGYEGLKELKISMAADSVKPNDQYISDQNIPESPQILQETIRRYIACLQDTLLIDNGAAFEQAVSAILKAPKIDVYGVGGSISNITFFRHMLIKVGIRVNECYSVHSQQLSAATLSANDAVIVITNRGESGELVQIIPRVREAGASVICITSRPSSIVARMSNIVLAVAGGTRFNTIAAPRVGINAVLDAVCHEILRKKEAEQSARKT